METSPVSRVEDHEELQDVVTYIVAGSELCPETGRHHWQTYVQFKTPMTMQRAKKLFDDNTMHWEVQQARDNKKAIEYCKKEGRWTEWGTPKKQGKRNDLPTREDLAEAETKEDLITTVDFGSYIRYKRNIDEAWEEIQEAKRLRHLAEDADTAELRPWQRQFLEDIIDTPRRKITWVWDSEGNKGKSYLAEHMAITEGALVTQRTVTADLAYAYRGHPYVIFDLTRSEWDPNYACIEMFTNRTIFSNKYTSTMKACVAKVIVFANSPPDLSKLSQDRWNVINLTS